MRTNSFEKPLNGIVEADETFVGGVKHGHGKGSRSGDKTPVFGMIERQGELRTMPIVNVKSETIKPIIRTNISPESILMTDNYAGYKGLEKEFKEHNVIAHSRHIYVRGNVHTNTIEGFWSLLKRGILGIYHHVSPKHLHRYCEEFEYRYNTRKLTETDRFALTLTQCAGRLTYKSLVGKS